MLLYCKGHIQMTSNDNTKNVETKNNRECTKGQNYIQYKQNLHYNIYHLPAITL